MQRIEKRLMMILCLVSLAACRAPDTSSTSGVAATESERSVAKGSVAKGSIDLSGEGDSKRSSENGTNQVTPSSNIYLGHPPTHGSGFAPSYSCKGALKLAVEELICSDAQLKKLDDKMLVVEQRILRQLHQKNSPTWTKDTTDSHQSGRLDTFKSEQQQWLKQRNDCSKEVAVKECLLDSYTSRLATLRAKFEIVNHAKRLLLKCPSQSSWRFIVSYYDTDLPSIKLERQGSSRVLLLTPSGTGSLYQGEGVTYWENQGKVMIDWEGEVNNLQCWLPVINQL